MAEQTGSRSSLHLLRCPPSRLSAAGSPRLLALSHITAEIHPQSLALAETLQDIMNTHPLNIENKIK